MDGVTPALLEQIVRGLSDRIHALEVQDPGAGVGAWSDFVPTIIQSGTLTNTVSYARWRAHGRAVDVELNCTVSSAGVAPVIIQVVLAPEMPPFHNNALHSIKGVGVVLDLSTLTYYSVHVHPRGARDIYFFRTDAPATNLFGIDPAVALADGDQISFSMRYEA